MIVFILLSYKLLTTPQKLKFRVGILSDYSHYDL